MDLHLTFKLDTHLKAVLGGPRNFYQKLCTLITSLIVVRYRQCGVIEPFIGQNTCTLST
jgi:hypothetical protein